MNADEWDERYRAAELVWGIRPNRWVEQELAQQPPGRALDLACGEGRNAIWLAELGWQVSAVDFSPVGLDKARALATNSQSIHPVDWICADVTTYHHPTPLDLALICYLHVVSDERTAVVRAAAGALAPGGVLLVIGHHSRNLEHGTGGPQDPAVLFSHQDIVEDLAGTGLLVDIAQIAERPVGEGPVALDALVRAHRPA